MRPLTSQKVRLFIGKIVLALTQAVSHGAKGFNADGFTGGGRAEGSSRRAEDAQVRGSLHARPFAGPAGSEMGRQRPGPPRYWPNPSSTEGGRPWPPSLPRWW